MTAGFLASIAGLALAIVLLTPEYSKPAVSAPRQAALPSPAASLAPSPAAQDSEAGTRPPAELTGYRWPVEGGKIVGWFGPSESGLIQGDQGRIHEGLDIEWWCGAPVGAAHKGRVLAAGRDVLGALGFDATPREMARLQKRLERRLGKQGLKDVVPLTVVVDDGNGYRSVYRHLADIGVKRGERVRAGALIGHVGQTGTRAPCHLQYELVRMDGEWQRVIDSQVKRMGYPKWMRERVDPMAVLDLEASPAPKVRKRYPRPG